MFIQIVPVDVSIFRIQSFRTKQAALEIRKDLVRDYLKYKRGTRRLDAVRRPNQAPFPGVVPLDRRLRSHTRFFSLVFDDKRFAEGPRTPWYIQILHWSNVLL